MKPRFSVRTLQLVCAVVSVAVVGPLAAHEPRWLLLALSVYSLFAIFGMAIGYHRGLAHDLLLESSKWTWICLLLGTLSTHGRPVGWVLFHRLHHANSDHSGDPHSPVRQGFWSVALNYWSLPVGNEDVRFYRRQVVRSVLKRRAARFFQRYYYRTILGFVVGLILAAGWRGVVFGYCLPVTLSILGNSLVNAVCHRRGVPSDNWWLSLITFGEGIHGTHHAQTDRMNLSHGLYVDVAGFLMERIVGVDKIQIGSNEN